MAKKTTLKQLSEKKYTIIEGLPPEISVFIGELEDSFDAIFYGDSGNGKSNMIAGLLGLLIEILDCRAEYIAFEEGSGKTMQDTLIKRADLLNKIGNKISIVDRYSYDELVKEMGKRRSAKIWVIDSLQASGFTPAQCLELKKFIKSKNGKIIFYVSWAAGKKPHGALGTSVEYYANIKVYIKDLVAFPKSRYGGNNPYIVYEPVAKTRWDKKQFSKIQKQIKDAIKNLDNHKSAKSGRPLLCAEENDQGSVRDHTSSSDQDTIPDLQTLGSVGSGG